MSYDLTNSAGGSHEWRVLGWWNLLNLASRYGWQPIGTRNPTSSEDDRAWNGNYFENVGQEVTATDAASLAQALAAMLRNPNRESVAREVIDRLESAIADESLQGEVDPLDVLTYPLGFVRQMLRHFRQTEIGRWSFDERSNEYLQQFIDFCRAGAFRIE